VRVAVCAHHLPASHSRYATSSSLLWQVGCSGSVHLSPASQPESSSSHEAGPADDVLGSKGPQGTARQGINWLTPPMTPTPTFPVPGGLTTRRPYPFSPLLLMTLLLRKHDALHPSEALAEAVLEIESGNLAPLQTALDPLARPAADKAGRPPVEDWSIAAIRQKEAIQTLRAEVCRHSISSLTSPPEASFHQASDASLITNLRRQSQAIYGILGYTAFVSETRTSVGAPAAPFPQAGSLLQLNASRPIRRAFR
jgi:hypothetical protein